MATVTDDDVRHDRYLLDRPQRLGIMPTWWFWNRRENWRWVRWPFAILVVASVMGLLLAEVPLVLALPIYVAVYVVALGSVERYIRQQAKHRRKLAESATRDALEERRD